jgi:arsenite methyltransferase
MSDVREEVRAHYRDAALQVLGGGSGSCCEPECCSGPEGSTLYGIEERASLPDAAVLASLGCGNPTAVAELRAGETVLDLGSGGGIDVILSAKRVGETGKAFGLDMTDEMLELARRNAAEAGASNVEFVKGYMEDVPLPDASVDVVISNCVINLSVDKPKVFAEIHRVLRPGGRLGISGRPVAGGTRRAGEQRGVHRRGAVVRRVRRGAAACGLRRDRGRSDARGR